MRSNYKRLGPYIREVVAKNSKLEVKKLLGVSITKQFIPSIANTIGTDMSKYKVVQPNQFAYGPVTSRNGDKISVALLQEDNCIISTSYTVFEIIDTEALDPEYLMMWFRRPEFDRYARFMSHGSVRELFGWDEMCDVELPIPYIDKQLAIVREYNTIVERIKLNEQINQKLEETAQAIYRQWFVDFEFPISAEYAASIGKPELEGNPYKSSGGEMVYSSNIDMEIPKIWEIGSIGQYATVKSGYAFKSDWWVDKGVPVIKIGNIQNNTISFDSVDYVTGDKCSLASQFIAKAGDIVIAMTGATIGKLALVPNLGGQMLVNQRVGLFDLGDNPIRSAPYLYCMLRQNHVQEEIKNVGGDSAQANISPDQIQDISIVIPQRETIGSFNEYLGVGFKKIMDNQLESVSLRKTKVVLKERMTVIKVRE